MQIQTPVQTVTLDLEIDNFYEDGAVITYKTITVEAPPAEEMEAAYDDWLYGDGSIFEATGTGRTEGDAAYFVKVTKTSDETIIPVGTEWEFGL